MKFKNYLTAIENVSIYPLFSLLLFTVFFAVVSWYVFSSEKSTMDKNSLIPIKD